MKITYFKTGKEFEEAFELYIRGHSPFKRICPSCGHRGSRAIVFETMRGLEKIVKCKKCYNKIINVINNV